MPVYDVTIGNNPPLGSLLVPRMAQHSLKPKPARNGEYTRFIGENFLPEKLLSMGLESEIGEFLQHPVTVTVVRATEMPRERA
jgi:hypothetical protein